jgi:MFS transporter, ACS family, glucarate transporter
VVVERVKIHILIKYIHIFCHFDKFPKKTLVKKRHQVLLALSILSMITFLDRIAFSTASGRITQALGLSAVQWGWILSTFTLAYGLFEIPTGFWGDKVGAKRILTRVVLWWSLFTVLTGFATGFMSLIVIRFLFGVGEAGAYPNTSIVLAKWFPANERAQAQAFIWGASRIGAAIAPLLVVPIQQAYGWQMSFYFLGIIGVVWAIFWYFWHKEDPTEAADLSQHELSDILNNRQLDLHSPKIPLRDILKNKNLQFLMLMYGCYASGAVFFQSWLPKYLQQGRGISENELKTVAALPFILGAFGCFFGGFLSDKAVLRYGKTWGRRIVPMIGMSIAGVLMIISALTENNTVSITLLSVGMAFMDVTAPVSWAVAMDIGGTQSGTTSGATNTAGLATAYFTTLSFGYLATAYGYYFPVVMQGAMLLVGAVLWLKIDAAEVI